MELPPFELMSYTVILLSSIAGFIIPAYILRSKKEKEKHMVCPLDTDCDAVVRSSYAYFLGIRLEYIGMTYYAIIGILYAYFLAVQTDVHPGLLFSILVLTSAAFLFSVYLTALQAWVIKMWCSLCLISAGLCGVIFVAALTASATNIIELMELHTPYLILGYMFGVALGVGGATMAMIFLIRAMEDDRITANEAHTVRSAWQFIWFALAIVLISGAGLALPYHNIPDMAFIYIFEIIALFVVLILSLILNFLIGPSLFEQQETEKEYADSKDGVTPQKSVRRAAFMMGAMFTVSWYALLLGATARLMGDETIDTTFFAEPSIVLLSYLILLILSIVAARFINSQLARKHTNSH